MKIALFIASLGGGGAERVLVDLAEEFAARGHTVDLVVGDLKGAVYLKPALSAVRIVDLKVSRMTRSVPALVRYLREYQPDVMLATRAHSCCVAVVARVCAGTKTALVLREANTLSVYFQNRPWRERLFFGLAVRICYPWANAVIGVSQGVVNDLKKYILSGYKKLYVVYSPLITGDMFDQAAVSLDHPWFKEGSPVILAVGRLSAQKRFDVLIRAFAVLRQEINVKLLILGEGELREYLQGLIKTLDLEKDIQLFGFDPNPFKFMKHARFLVMSSDWEGLPGVLVQALACGCPVVSTDCASGPREILKDGRWGTLIPVGNVMALTQAMREALSKERVEVDPAELDEYTMVRSADHYLKIFNSVLR